MIKNMSLGQYYPGKSFIHNLDPRTKIIIAMVLLVSVFFIDTFAGFAVLAVFLLAEIAVSRVGVGCALKSLKPLWFIIVFTFVLNIFFYDGQTVLWEYGVMRITQEGLLKAAFIAIRLVLLLLSTSLLTLTTSPMQLTDAMESLLAPLRKIKFPVHEMSMMMSIALRFIPTLSEETDRIKKAQTARGAEFDSGNIFVRAKNMIPLLVPLFVSAFKRADELALAMESRCYHGGDNRTKMRQLKLTKNDAWTLILTGALVAVLVIWL